MAAHGDDLRPEDADRELARVERLVDWLDTRFRIPGTNVRFGLDPILGLVPGVGDSASLLASIYVVLCLDRIGVPRRHLPRMGFNILLDSIVGSIPLLGDLFDVGFKANRKNLDLARRVLARRRA